MPKYVWQSVYTPCLLFCPQPDTINRESCNFISSKCRLTLQDSSILALHHKYHSSARAHKIIPPLQVHKATDHKVQQHVTSIMHVCVWTDRPIARCKWVTWFPTKYLKQQQKILNLSILILVQFSWQYLSFTKLKMFKPYDLILIWISYCNSGIKSEVKVVWYQFKIRKNFADIIRAKVAPKDWKKFSFMIKSSGADNLIATVDCNQ